MDVGYWNHLEADVLYCVWLVMQLTVLAAELFVLDRLIVTKRNQRVAKFFVTILYILNRHSIAKGDSPLTIRTTETGDYCRYKEFCYYACLVMEITALAVVWFLFAYWTRRCFHYNDRVLFRRNKGGKYFLEIGRVARVNPRPDRAYTVRTQWHGWDFDVDDDTYQQIRILPNHEYEAIVCKQFGESLSIGEIQEIYMWSYRIECYTIGSRRDIGDISDKLLIGLGSALMQLTHHGIKAAYIEACYLMMVTNKAFESFVRGIVSSEDLQHLIVDLGSNHQKRRIGTVVAMVIDRGSLHRLSLRNCRIPFLEGCETFLKDLYLFDCFETEEDYLSIERFAKTLRRATNSTLETFRCSFCSPTERSRLGFFNVLKCFCQNDVLTSLWLDSPDMGDEVVRGVCRLLGTTQTLRELSVFPTMLNAITTSMPGENSSVESLWTFCPRERQPQDAQMLANQLMCFRRLRHIDLWHWIPRNDTDLRTSLNTMLSILHGNLFVERLNWSAENTTEEAKAEVDALLQLQLLAPDSDKVSVVFTALLNFLTGTPE